MAEDVIHCDWADASVFLLASVEPSSTEEGSHPPWHLARHHDVDELGDGLRGLVSLVRGSRPDDYFEVLCSEA